MLISCKAGIAYASRIASSMSIYWIYGLTFQKYHIWNLLQKIPFQANHQGIRDFFILSWLYGFWQSPHVLLP